jgi:hypothetical protein
MHVENAVDAQRFVNVKVPMPRTLNIAQGDVLRMVELFSQSGLLDFTEEGFAQKDFRTFWDTETKLHDDLVAYIFRPRVYALPVIEWHNYWMDPGHPTAQLMAGEIGFPLLVNEVGRDLLKRLMADPLRSVGVHVLTSQPFHRLAWFYTDAITALEDQLIEYVLGNHTYRLMFAGFAAGKQPAPLRSMDFKALAHSLREYMHGALISLPPILAFGDEDARERAEERVKAGFLQIARGAIQLHLDQLDEKRRRAEDAIEHWKRVWEELPPRKTGGETPDDQ